MLVKEQYAIIEASYVLVRILQTFGKIRSRDARAWREKLGFVLFNEHGVLVEFGN